MKTILITGCSSGFGLETARHFVSQNWNVIATMRTPNQEVLPESANLRVLPLDVTDSDSIAKAVELAGPVDVLVNNAGVGFLSAVEGTSTESVRGIFETNIIGPIALARAFIPQFRERRSGTIINVSSSVTLKSLPLLSIYTASKHALNGFTESMALELEPFGIRVRLVLPGRAPQTQFGDNAQRLIQGFPEPYSDLVKAVFSGFAESDGPITKSSDVTEAIWRAATDPDSPQRLVAGADAVMWAEEESKHPATA